MKISNKQILDKTLMSQLLTINEDDTINNVRNLKLGYNYLMLMSAHFQALNIQDSFRNVLENEIVKELDNYLVTQLIQNTKHTVNYDFGPTFMDSSEILMHEIKKIITSHSNKDNLAIIANPMLISIMQASIKRYFQPAGEDSFKGSNNTMLIGHLTLENNLIPIYSFIFDSNEDCLLFVDTSNSDTMLVSPNLINADVETQATVIGSDIYKRFNVNFKLNMEGTVVTKLNVNLKF